MEDSQLFSNRACWRINWCFFMSKEKMEKAAKEIVAALEYDDVLWLIQQCSVYERGLADGTVTAECGRRLMNCIIKTFKYYL